MGRSVDRGVERRGGEAWLQVASEQHVMFRRRARGLHVMLLCVAWGCASGRDAGPVATDRDPATTRDAAVDADSRPDARPDTEPDAAPEEPVEFVDLCDECTVHAQCGELGRCVELTPGQKVCTRICNREFPDCPEGFSCVQNYSAPGVETCVPIGERCCFDEDRDGYGQGAACLGPDCDESSIDINPGSAERCNGTDDDCDDAIDEASIDCAPQRCLDTGGGLHVEYPEDSCESAACIEIGAMSCGLYACSEGHEEGDYCATLCTNAQGVDDDAFCTGMAHCDRGICEEDRDDGDSCDEDTDCGSGYCDNGFCCSGGTCCNQAADCPSVDGIGATCDDAVTCQGSRGEIACENFSCVTYNGVADDSACGVTTEADDCGAYASIYCTGETNQTPPHCATSCVLDTECDDGAHCDGACTPDLADGASCDEDSDCESEQCESGVCCRGEHCCLRASDCPAEYGSAASCDAPVSCQGTRDAAICQNFVCQTALDVPDDSACSVSVEAKDCGLYPSRFCSGGTDQNEPACATSCTADAECDEGAHCDLGACVPDLPDGSACDEASDCVSDHCQNGFCCSGGDCCATAAHCDSAQYGEASTCLDVPSCQGARRDPICVDFQCGIGPLLDDDSGCGGLTSQECGLFSDVACSSALDQTAQQRDLCRTRCMGTSDCDTGAFCNASGECQAEGDVGDPCQGTGQCGDGLACVDGVCCTSACNGACEACDVPGEEGTCTAVPDGTDPDNECGAVSCGEYFAGWQGDSCYRRANAASAEVSCNGNRACETAADVCPRQPEAAVQITCGALCEDPVMGTCAGTNAGVCNDVTPSPATQTCGVGACQVTMPRCDRGDPVVCVPQTPEAESCNDVDDDCDARVDEGLSSDQYEPNDLCGQGVNLGTLYSTARSGEPRELVISPNLYGASDTDVYRIDFTENDDDCGCGSWSFDEDHAIAATIAVPEGAGSYRLCIAAGTSGASCSRGNNCITVAGGQRGNVTQWKDGACGLNAKDRATFWFFVEGMAAPSFECAPYELHFEALMGCR